MESGQKLSMHSDNVFKGSNTHNGILLKLHENSFTIGYSALLAPDGSTAGVAKFGYGVFLNVANKNNKVYVGKSTEAGAVSSFGGIMVREAGIASGYPVYNDQVSQFQKGMLCRDGFIGYKYGRVYLSSDVSYDDVQLFDYVYNNYVLWIKASDGSFYFSPKASVYETEGDTMVGRVASTNPDDESVTVNISTSMLADTADIAGITPSVTLSGTTANATTALVAVGINSSVRLAYKETADTAYTLLKDVYVTEYNESTSKYEVTETIDGLTAGTDYTVKAIAISACGAKSATATVTTTA